MLPGQGQSSRAREPVEHQNHRYPPRQERQHAGHGGICNYRRNRQPQPETMLSANTSLTTRSTVNPFSGLRAGRNVNGAPPKNGSRPDQPAK